MKKKAARIGSLWNRTSRDGNSYKSVSLDMGPLGEVYAALFSNEKEKESQPDYILVCGHTQIGAFWLRKTDEGKKYLSGNVLDVPVNIFPNEEKVNERAPDYRMVRFLPSEEPVAEESTL